MDLPNTQVHDEAVKVADNTGHVNETKPDAADTQEVAGNLAEKIDGAELDADKKACIESEGQNGSKDELPKTDEGQTPTGNHETPDEEQAKQHPEGCSKTEAQEKPQQETKPNTNDLTHEQQKDGGSDQSSGDDHKPEDNMTQLQHTDAPNTEQKQESAFKTGENATEDLKVNNKDAETHLDEDSSVGSNDPNSKPSNCSTEPVKKDLATLVSENDPTDPDGHRHKKVKTSD